MRYGPWKGEPRQRQLSAGADLHPHLDVREATAVSYTHLQDQNVLLKVVEEGPP